MNAKFSRADIVAAAALRKEDPGFWTYRKLGERFGVSGQLVFHALGSDGARKTAIIRRASLEPITRLHSSVAKDAAIRLSEIPEDTRDLTARFFGDPLPGRSALDQKRARVAR